jgi:energy-coupling factor transporter ATP-binding protein EcfA2
MGIEYLFMAVVGGVGHVWGALVGASAVQILKDQLQVWLPKLMGTSGNYEVIVFGVLLVLVLQYARDGIWAFVEARLPRINRKVDWADAPALATRPRPPHGDVVLDVNAVRKEFGGLVAVNDVSFQVKAGEILGLIGPNGAGKSTTFNLVTGVLPATRGKSACSASASIRCRRARSRGAACRARSAREDDRRHDGARERRARRPPARPARLPVGAAAPRPGRGAQPDARGRGAAGPHRHGRVDARACRQSRARAAAPDGDRARAVRGPDLLLLDEPAAGLRHKEKQGLADVLRQLRSEGLSILLVEHDMDLVMGLVDRVVVMEFGTKLIEGTPDVVQASRRFALRTSGRSIDDASHLDGWSSASREGSCLCETAPGIRPAAELLSFAGPNESHQSKVPQHTFVTSAWRQTGAAFESPRSSDRFLADPSSRCDFIGRKSVVSYRCCSSHRLAWVVRSKALGVERSQFEAAGIRRRNAASQSKRKRSDCAASLNRELLPNRCLADVYSGTLLW